MGESQAAVKSAFRGRIGLALSGGGFRASLFHIGVLAQLAELDLLRPIECLSCVSGGSIIGAHYYLHVRHLLRSKPDHLITADDYVHIVKKIVEEFLAGVQRNIRTRVAAEWKTNFKMIFFRNYSRTLRVGELYERELFSRVHDGEGASERWLNQLFIVPKDEHENFVPKRQNWKRQAKVPVLILNSTTLNTGHNWQFTASWMGEPPGDINNEIDANYRLRRIYYEDTPRSHQKIRLGHAVAASSCVPGLFEPLPLNGLYPDRIVGLVDGGVHDNQGTFALKEQQCTVILVSDASGQMEALNTPPSGLLSVPLRANSILQARIRETQFEELSTRHRAGLLFGFIFLHLKKDLESEPVDWVDCQDPSRPKVPSPLTSYGIQKAVQRQLQQFERTWIFLHTEAYALMTSGYLMATAALTSGNLGFSLSQSAESSWKFLRVRRLMERPAADRGFLLRLRVAEYISFKIWRLSRVLQLASVFVSVLLLGLILVIWLQWRPNPPPKLTIETTLESLIAIFLFTSIASLAIPIVIRAMRFQKTLQQFAIGLGMATFGFIIARLHLHVFDRIFLWMGRVR